MPRDIFNSAHLVVVVAAVAAVVVVVVVAVVVVVVVVVVAAAVAVSVIESDNYTERKLTIKLITTTAATTAAATTTTTTIAAVPDVPDVSVLRRRLVHVFHQDSMSWLSVPFLEGILYSGDHMNCRVFIPDNGEPFPLLHCLCQYKLLQKQFHYKGANDMIALAIRAGAMVKSSIR